MPRLASFEDRVADVQRRLRQLSAPLVVGFSGGTDSLALAILCAGVRPETRLVHVHHGLHASADDGARHAEQLGASVALAFEMRRVDGAAIRASSVGLEAAARKARYAALADAAGDDGLVLTAHTADDRVETLIMRLAQGSGIDGLRGPRRALKIGHARVRRVMLGLWREDTERVVRDSGLVPWHDPMNDDLHHLRVRIRAELAPALRDLLGRNALLRSIEQLGDDAEVVARVTAKLLDAATVSRRAASLRLDRASLRALAPAERRSVIRAAVIAIGARPTRDVVCDASRRISTQGPATLMAHRMRIEIDQIEVRMAAVADPRAPLGDQDGGNSA